MHKKILVPIDFSADSINALEHAIDFAGKINADVRMINVKKGDVISIPAYFKDFNLAFAHTPQYYFDLLIEKYKPKIKGKFDYKVREGKVFREVVNQAKYDDTYLIMMGTHGISGFEEFFIGSNAYKVVANAPCPIITIRNGFLRKGIKKIVLPIDASSETRQKVAFAAELAQYFHAEIHSVSVRETKAKDIIDKLEVYTNQVCEVLSSKKVKCHTESLHGDNITDITIKYAQKVDAELIVIMTEQSQSPMNLWLGDYAQQMVNHSPIPVLNIRPGQKKE